MKSQKTISPQEISLWLTPNFAVCFLLFLNCFIGAYSYSVHSPTVDFFTWWAVPHGLARQYVQIPYTDENRKKLAEKIKGEIETTKSPNIERETFDDVLDFYNGRIISTASPFFYAVFSHCVSDNYQLDKRKFIIVSLLLFTLTIFILGRLLNFSYPALFVFYSLITTSFAPYLSEAKVGNVNQIQLFLVSIFILLSIKKNSFYSLVGAGFFLGLSALLKANMG